MALFSRKISVLVFISKRGESLSLTRKENDIVLVTTFLLTFSFLSFFIFFFEGCKPIDN